VSRVQRSSSGATTTCLATGLGFTEGPAVLADGRLAFVNGVDSLLAYEGGRITPLVYTRGGPNGLTTGSDGALYVAQSGLSGGLGAAMPPGVQRAWPDGSVELLATRIAGYALGAPNDLAFGPDGRLYLTDPGGPYDRAINTRPGRIFALGTDTSDLVLELGNVYVNGVGFDCDCRLVWTESFTRRLMRLGGERQIVLHAFPDGHVPDGFAIADDGRIYVATLTSRGISVIAPSGQLLEHLPVDGWPTNCAFLGDQLYVTAVSALEDHGTGMLWSIETGARGLPLHRGQLSPTAAS
jgi:gluconolactonase